MDIHPSRGYESVADVFAQIRENTLNRIGYSTVYEWACMFPKGAQLLDVGCGTGKPITQALLDSGATVYALDASASMVRKFKQHFPKVPIRQESAFTSSYFDLTYDGIVAWGVIFLFPEQDQIRLFERLSGSLKPEGLFLFTSPAQNVTWNDTLTGLESVSLGRERYLDVFSHFGYVLDREWEDEGENHYFSMKKAG